MNILLRHIIGLIRELNKFYPGFTKRLIERLED